MCYLIHGIDVVDPFALVLIALMDRINADIAWFVVGARLTPLTYRSGFGACFCQGAALPLIGLGGPQVVQVRNMPAILYPEWKIIKKYNTIGYSGGTIV